MALAALHRNALTNEQGMHGLLHDCYQAFGLETTYHLGGILQEAHRDEPNEGYAETLSLLRPREEWEPIQAVVEQWLTERSENRKVLDTNRPKMVWERQVLSLRRHPDVTRDGHTFLECLWGCPKLLQELVLGGTLLQTVLARQKMAADYKEHAVLRLGEDPLIAQREAEREFLLMPQEARTVD